jgi:3-phenylpropionate/trans-cinnamate dioxygenase ferredoxin subunit
VRREVEVCDLDDLRDGQIRSVAVGRTQLVAAMSADGVKVFFGACPHQGAPLGKGRMVTELAAGPPGELRLLPESRLLRCPWHGYEFELAEGRALTDRDVCLRFVPSSVSDGKVLVAWPPVTRAEGAQHPGS